MRPINLLYIFFNKRETKDQLMDMAQAMFHYLCYVQHKIQKPKYKYSKSLTN
jgi:hypothetical protein